MPTREQKNPKREAETLSLVRAVRASDARGRARVVAAILASILFHVLLVTFIPADWLKTARTVQREEGPFRVLLEEPEVTEESEDFSLTNPEVASNPPDEARYFSDRDQQAAQENPAEEGDAGTPEIEGEEPEKTQNIVEGESEMTPEEMVEWAEDRMPVLEQLPETRPIPGFAEVENEEGSGPVVTEETEPLVEKEVTIGVPLDGSAENLEELARNEETPPVEETRPQPRPRPTLPRLSPNPVGRREGAAPRIGEVAVDAKFSEYGDYIARMLDVIVRQWHLLAWETLGSAESGTLVAVSFRIDSSGAVDSVEVLRSTASLTATLICQDAIASRQPYGPWTRDMVEVLGEEQTINIRFSYR